MHGPARPPTFDPSDWAQFDFSRWHLDGLPVEAVPAAVADLAQRLFASDEWRQRFQASLPAVQRGVLDAYREHARQLEEERAATARDFDQRITDAQIRSEEFGQGIEAGGSPPVVEPDPHTYLLGVRVTAGAEPRLGLTGLVVQVIAPRDKTALAQSLTDRDGNALLAIPAARASASAKRDATLEILTADGKSLQQLPDSVCIRPNQAETKVVVLQDSEDVAPLKSAALELRSQREVRGRELVVRIDRLRQDRDDRLRYLDQQLNDVRATIAQLEGGDSPPPSGDASKEPPSGSPTDRPGQSPGPTADRPGQSPASPAGRPSQSPASPAGRPSQSPGPTASRPRRGNRPQAQ